MTKRMNQLPSFIRPREMNFLKVAGISFLLLCTVPQLVVADTYEGMTVTTTQQNGKVNGIITDPAGEPLIGVSIIVKGTANGTITNMDGKFSLDAKKGETLEVSYIGYKTLTIKVSEAPLTLIMEEDSQKLDEVIVVGYGTTTKRSMISSVSRVDASEMENLPIVNITQGLAGRAPGLIVKASGGGINKNSSISIRGGNTPLVVIDGVIREYNDFTTLAPEDIESMSVLKDASATAVYGSRAANGILQVTTKAGSKSGKPSVNYSFNQSFAQPNIWPDKLNSYKTAIYANEAAKNDGKDIPYTEEALNGYRDGTDIWNYPNTDWRKLVLRSFAPTQKHNVSITGGTEANQYFISLGNINQESLYRTNTHNMQRSNFRVNQSSLIKSIGLKTTVQLDGYMQETIQPASSTAGYNRGDPYYFVFSHLSNMGPMGHAYNKHGLLLANGDNPVAETSEDAGYGRKKDVVVNGKLGVEWAVPWVKGLNLKGTGS